MSDTQRLGFLFAVTLGLAATAIGSAAWIIWGDRWALVSSLLGLILALASSSAVAICRALARPADQRPAQGGEGR